MSQSMAEETQTVGAAKKEPESYCRHNRVELGVVLFPDQAHLRGIIAVT